MLVYTMHVCECFVFYVVSIAEPQRCEELDLNEDEERGGGERLGEKLRIRWYCVGLAATRVHL
jgi:hypothetical protein